MHQPESLGSTIWKLREERGVRRSELARKIGCHYHTLSNIEYGRRNPSVVLLHRIARELDTDVASIRKAAA